MIAQFVLLKGSRLGGGARAAGINEVLAQLLLFIMMLVLPFGGGDIQSDQTTGYSKSLEKGAFDEEEERTGWLVERRFSPILIRFQSSLRQGGV